MEIKIILSKIQNLLDKINSIFKQQDLSDEVMSIFQILSLSCHWVYYNIIFAEENLRDWMPEGKVIKSLKKEFKESPNYRISKILMDKSLISIYSHYYIIIESGSRISFPTLKIDEKYIKNLYKRPYVTLQKELSNQNTLNLKISTIENIKEIRNFRNNLIHYYTWYSTVTPSDKIDIYISSLYRKDFKGVVFWEDKKTMDTIFLTRDFKINCFEKFGEDFKKHDLVNLKETIFNDFKTLNLFIHDIAKTSILYFDEWSNKIINYYK